MNGFVWDQRRDVVIGAFSLIEADLLRSLASQMVELLHDQQAAPTTPEDPLEAMLDFDGPTTAPEDPVLQRLFPNAYGDAPDQAEASGEFRRYTESTLRTGKSDNALAVVEGLETAGLPDEPGGTFALIEIELTGAEAESWMKAFTDIRLALGVRLGVEQDDHDLWATLPDDDPRAQAHGIFEWVGFLQETLVEALMERSHGDS